MSQDYVVIAAGIVFLALIVIGLIRRIRKDESDQLWMMQWY